MKHPCSLCGSRDWPSADSECLLCNDGATVEDFEDTEEHDEEPVERSSVRVAPTETFRDLLIRDFQRRECSLLLNLDYPTS